MLHVRDTIFLNLVEVHTYHLLIGDNLSRGIGSGLAEEARACLGNSSFRNHFILVFRVWD